MTDRESEPRCHAPRNQDIRFEPRLCRNCGLTKAVTEFHLNKSKLGGRDSQCRQCVTARKKEKRRRKHEQENIDLNITFNCSAKFTAAMDGVLGLIL